MISVLEKEKYNKRVKNDAQKARASYPNRYIV